MPQAPRQEDLLVLLDKMERRLRALEGASRMRSAGQPGGSFVLNESDGTGEWLRWGEITLRDGSAAFGFMVNGVDGDQPARRSIEIGQNGLHIPAQHGCFSPISYSQGVSVGTFQDIYRMEFWQATSDAFETFFAVIGDAASTFEVRLHNGITGGATSDAIAVPAGFSGFYRFSWLHQMTVTDGPFRPSIQARRTSGAGTANVFFPESAFQVAGYLIDATTSGIGVP